MSGESDTAHWGGRVLMFVSGFPPARQSILRTAKFAKYLPEYGWTPVVITPFSQMRGSSQQLGTVPNGVVVKRTPRFPGLSVVAAAIRPSREGTGKMVTAPPSGARVAGVAARIEAAGRTMVMWGDTPDAFVGWIPFAAATGWWLARRCGASAIYASGPPFSVVCAGAIVSRLTGLPLIADFRDAWTLDPADPFGLLSGSFAVQPAPKRIWLLKALERWVVVRSRAVLFTSGATRSLYVARYPEIQERSYVVYNGVDLDDFGGDVAVRERPTVAHVGTLHEYQRKQVELFLHGFARALMTGRVPSETEVVFAGTIGLKLRVRLQTIVRSLGITGSVRLADFLPHTDAVYWMRASRLLLLFAGDNYYIRLSKISEYIAAGRPLLALAAEKSETAQEVRAYGGRVISDASEVSIEAELARVFAGSAPQCCASHRFDHPHPLNRRTEAKYLADILSRNVADVNASTVSK